MDDRLVGLQDVMPTLLDLAGIQIPESVDGISMVGQERRRLFYGEYGEGDQATRMVHDGQFKLIYYAAGNRMQLFDLKDDPHELCDLVESPEYRQQRERLTSELIQNFYGSDLSWVRDGELVGLPLPADPPALQRGLALQRGRHWPVPPQGTE